MTIHAYRVYIPQGISRVHVFILTFIIIIILFHFLHNLSCVYPLRTPAAVYTGRRPVVTYPSTSDVA